jgi:hypothetical protein
MLGAFLFGENKSISSPYFYVMLNILDTRQRVEKQMNLDLLTTEQLKTYYTNRWCVEQGIKSRDLLNHPYIDDAILLINIRQEFWQLFNATNRGHWAALWSRVYHKQYPLNKKYLAQVEKLTNIGISRQQHEAQLRQRIKAQRTNNIENGVVHMTTNPTPAAESLIGF